MSIFNHSSDNNNNLTKESFGSIWIVKPTALSCGRDIVVVKGIRELLLQVARMNFRCVVQKYIERPFLVRNQRKFDIRQWILVSNLNPMIIYGFSECYLRLSGRSFTLDDNDKFIHLCNHSIQKDDIQGLHNNNNDNNNNNNESESEKEDGSKNNIIDTNEFLCDTMMTQDEFRRYLGEDIYFQQIFPQIQTISIEAVLCCRDKLEKIGKGFEWLGLDLMITEDLQVALIEVNVSPDTTCSTPVTSRIVGPATRDLFELILDDQIVSESDDHSLSFVSQSCQLNLRFGVGESLTEKEIKQAARWIPNGVYGKGAEQIMTSSSLQSHSSSQQFSDLSQMVSQPIWKIWYVGQDESSYEMKKFSAHKISNLGKLTEKIKETNFLVDYSTLVNIILSNDENLEEKDDEDEDEI